MLIVECRDYLDASTTLYSVAATFHCSAASASSCLLLAAQPPSCAVPQHPLLLVHASSHCSHPQKPCNQRCCTTDSNASCARQHIGCCNKLNMQVPWDCAQYFLWRARLMPSLNSAAYSTSVIAGAVQQTNLTWLHNNFIPLSGVLDAFHDFNNGSSCCSWELARTGAELQFAEAQGKFGISL